MKEPIKTLELTIESASYALLCQPFEESEAQMNTKAESFCVVALALLIIAARGFKNLTQRLIDNGLLVAREGLSLANEWPTGNE